MPSIVEALSAPWAIRPDMLETIHAIAAARARGEVADIPAIEAKLGRPMQSEHRPYAVHGKVAVLPMTGVLGKRMNLMSAMSGGTSTQLIQRDLAMAVADPDVEAIVLDIDSPGGTVDGTTQLVAAVRAAAQQKTVVSVADGAMASAAYWIGSAASAIYAADETTQVGSIGVVQKHVDISGAEAQKGIRTTEITAGKYKRLGSPHKPLDDESRALLQEDVDDVYTMFVADVAAHRGVSEDKVLEDMADGRVFRGRKAQAAGLIDGIRSLESVVAELNAVKASRTPSGARATTHIATGATTMPQTIEQIRAESPEAYQQITEQARAEGAAAERARIQGVQEASMPGHEALIATMMFDGKTSAGDAALAVLQAEKKTRAEAAKAEQDDAPAAVPATARQGAASAAETDEKPSYLSSAEEQAEVVAKATTLAAQKNITFTAALAELGVK